MAQTQLPDLERVVPIFFSLSNAPPGERPSDLVDAIRDGDAEAVKAAGGTPLEALNALLRHFRHRQAVFARLRKFAEIADGAQLTYGEYLGGPALVRIAKDGSVTRISLVPELGDLDD